jgi:hypothetical protein
LIFRGIFIFQRYFRKYGVWSYLYTS